MFETVLVANRGEIALRVMRACRELNLKCIAVYSEADREAPHVEYADDAYLLGPGPAGASYLNIERIIEVAKQAGADAIHPGYGFLSENSKFARAVTDAGLVFVGPPPEATEALGGKTAARNIARAVGVPMVPGTLKPLKDAYEARATAEEFGYPIALKAVAGGGGRGMRVVRGEDEIINAYDSASREAIAAFSNGDLYMEKYLTNPRHIEIQILADQHGNIIYVGERDCSVQRRHQKLIEETPSPVISPALRRQMGEDAIKLPLHVGYVGAGTLEFLYQDGEYYFLEMNSRIQVEHTVSEMIYGIDLVKGQLRVAQGEPLWVTQEDMVPRGHAIECRVNAEDVLANFRPTLGKLTRYAEPAGLGVRVDSGVREGWQIPEYYDSLLAKLITWGVDREESLARMRRALRDFKLEGVPTTIPFFRAALEHHAFIAGEATVNFIPLYRDELLDAIEQYTPPTPPTADSDDEPPVRTFNVEVNSRRFSVRIAEYGTPLVPTVAVPTAPPPAPKAKSVSSAQAITSPLQGTVTETRIKAGDTVKVGQVIFIIQAMKMENEVTAPRDGKIAEVTVEVGETVQNGNVLAAYASE